MEGGILQTGQRKIWKIFHLSSGWSASVVVLVQILIFPTTKFLHEKSAHVEQISGPE